MAALANAGLATMLAYAIGGCSVLATSSVIQECRRRITSPPSMARVEDGTSHWNERSPAGSFAAVCNLVGIISEVPKMKQYQWC